MVTVRSRRAGSGAVDRPPRVAATTEQSMRLLASLLLFVTPLTLVLDGWLRHIIWFASVPAPIVLLARSARAESPLTRHVHRSLVALQLSIVFVAVIDIIDLRTSIEGDLFVFARVIVAAGVIVAAIIVALLVGQWHQAERGRRAIQSVANVVVVACAGAIYQRHLSLSRNPLEDSAEMRLPMAVLGFVLAALLAHSLISRRQSRQIEGWVTAAVAVVIVGLTLDSWTGDNVYRSIGALFCIVCLCVGWITAELPSEHVISPVVMKRDVVVVWCVAAIMIPAAILVSRVLTDQSWSDALLTAMIATTGALLLIMTWQTRQLTRLTGPERREHAELLNALSRGEFDIHYQQIVNTSSELCGAEALIRWHHPQRGLLSAAQFLPTDSDSDVSIAASRWAVKRVLSDVRVDRHRLSGRFVTVNVPPALFVDPWLMSTMREFCVNRPADTAVVLELVETARVRDWSAIRAVILELRDLGIDSALDDFGDGYAHLRAVRDTGAAIVKLDRSIVEGLSSEPGTIVLKAAIDMAHSLGCRVIAEGVEERFTADWLDTNGVDMQQGYLHGRPGPWFGAARASLVTA